MLTRCAQLNFARFDRPVSSHVRRLGGELFWVALGQIAVALGAIVGVRLLTEALSPTEYGQVALAMTLVGLTNQTLLGPISGATLRFFAPAQEAGQLLAFIGGSKRLLYEATTVLGVITLSVCVGLAVFGRANSIILAIPAFVFALLTGYGTVLDGMQNAARQRIVVAWHDSLAVWLRFLLAVALISAFGAYSYVALMGYVVASMVVLVSQYLFFRHRMFSLVSESDSSTSPNQVDLWAARMQRYALPFATWGVFTWLQVSSDRWTLQFFVGTAAVGLYTALYQLGYYPIVLLSTMAMQLAMPISFSRAGDGSDPTRLKAAHKLNLQLVASALGVTVMGVLLAIWFHGAIFSLFVAPEYRVVSSLMPLIVLGAGLFASGQMASITLLAQNNSRAMIAPKIGTALVGLAANFIGARWFGVKGVAVASIVFGVTYFLWTMVLAARITIPWGSKPHGLSR